MGLTTYLGKYLRFSPTRELLVSLANQVTNLVRLNRASKTGKSQICGYRRERCSRGLCRSYSSSTKIDFESLIPFLKFGQVMINTLEFCCL